MKFGDYRVEIIPDTEFKLDGGAMFGVVPRVLWERVCPPDDLNRIRMNMNCVFIETPSEKILIETGIGEKWSPQQIEMYGIGRKKPFAESLKTIAGCKPEEISIVVNTHLHFDHAGGNTMLNGSGDPVPQFPNARYLVSRNEFEHAEVPHERDRASYRPENWQPLIDSQQLEMKPDSYQVVDGLRVEQIRGHSETMQTWRLDRGGKTMYGFADLIPTRYHIKPAWVAGFDLYPVETLEFKKQIIPKAVEENWYCLFYHDIEMPLWRLVETNGKISAVDASNA